MAYNGSSFKCGLCKQNFPVNDGIPSLVAKLDTQEQEQLAIYEDTHASDIKSSCYVEYMAKTFFQLINNDYFLPLLFGKGIQNKVVLDIGSGCGNVGMQILNAGARIINIDISSKALRRARSFITATNADFIQGSIKKIPLADSSVDFAVAYFVLHHIENTEIAVSEIRRILKPGGHFICLEPAIRLSWAELWMDFFKVRGNLRKAAKKIYKFFQGRLAKDGSVKAQTCGREQAGRRHFFKNFEEYKKIIAEAGFYNLEMKTIFLEFIPPRYFESKKKWFVKMLFGVSDLLLKNVSSFSKKGKFIVMQARKN